MWRHKKGMISIQFWRRGSQARWHHQFEAFSVVFDLFFVCQLDLLLAALSLAQWCI
jgi:hypothetical protein